MGHARGWRGFLTGTLDVREGSPDYSTQGAVTGGAGILPARDYSAPSLPLSPPFTHGQLWARVSWYTGRNPSPQLLFKKKFFPSQSLLFSSLPVANFPPPPRNPAPELQERGTGFFEGSGKERVTLPQVIESKGGLQEVRDHARAREVCEKGLRCTRVRERESLVFAHNPSAWEAEAG